MKNFRICILMMLKNEADLALSWVKYHGSIFGFENLYIFDNGSDDEATLSAVRYAQESGANCYFDKSTFEDFKNKGAIFANLIKELDSKDPYDFYFPLDCDEFLAAKVDGNYVHDLEGISQSLAKYENSPDQLKVGSCPTNNPLKKSYYKIDLQQRKFFFAKGTCVSLDRGFHHGITKSGITVTTEIVYFHFHYREFLSIQFHSKKKLEGAIKSFDKATLSAYRGSSFHLTQYLLQDEKSYYDQFSKWEHEYIPSLESKFEALGLTMPVIASRP